MKIDFRAGRKFDKNVAEKLGELWYDTYCTMDL